MNDTSGSSSPSINSEGAGRHPQHKARPGVPRWLRIVLPAVLIVIWVALGTVGGPYFGKISQVSSNDQTSFLPASAEATQVQQRLADFQDTSAIPAVIVFAADGELSKDQLSSIDDAITELGAVEGVSGDTSPAIPSEDGKAVEVVVPVENNEDRTATIAELRTVLDNVGIDGVESYVTGPAGFAADLGKAFTGIDGLLLGVALLVVLVILLIVYRSPLLPFLVLGTSVFALASSILLVWWLAKAGIVTINGQVQGILFILVIGAATDYSLLYVSRYREALLHHARPWNATWAALKASIEPIAASAGTVIVGLLCLLFSDLNSNRALGPVAAIGIVFSFAAALTLLPSLLLACGRPSFWPLRPKFADGAVHHAEGQPLTKSTHAGSPAKRGLWVKLGALVARRPRLIWVLSTVVLLAAAVGATQFKADGVSQSDLVLSQSDARDGQVALGEHFPGGSGSPLNVLVPEDEVASVASTLTDTEGIDSVGAFSADSAAGTLAVSVDGDTVTYLDPADPCQPGSSSCEVKPTVADGDVLLQATLGYAADSAEAEQVVVDLRATFADNGPEGVQIGGVTATALDTNTAAIHDRNTIIPIVLVVITLILMLLLRSILAPVLLILSVIVSYAAALGVSAWVFTGIFGFPGADPAVPLYGFVFLVALGIDYNIFLMTRVREESVLKGTRAGILRGLTVTGGVITSAGLVLAATFAALSVIPILFLVQLAFIVAFGVLLDTFLVRTLLVPALSYDLGKVIWWPSALWRKGKI